MLTASVKGGQAFVSTGCQRRPETQSAPFPSAQTTESLQPALVQNGKQLVGCSGPDFLLSLKSNVK